MLTVQGVPSEYNQQPQRTHHCVASPLVWALDCSLDIQMTYMKLLLFISLNLVSAFSNADTLTSLEDLIVRAISVEPRWHIPTGKVIESYKPAQYLPVLISIAASNQSKKVRMRSAYWLSSFYTDNGAEGYLHIDSLENNLDILLTTLNETNTSRAVINILGARYTGANFAPCYMSEISRDKIISALVERKNFIQKAKDNYPSKEIKWNNDWNYEFNELNTAIRATESCNLTRK